MKGIDRDPVHQLSTELVIYASRLARAVRRQIDDELPTTTLRLLAEIESREPVGISALAQFDRCSQPTMSAAVRQLAAKGLVVRDADPRDGRAVLVRLTDAGVAELHSARERLGAAVAEWFVAAGKHSNEDLQNAVELVKALVDQAVERSD